MGQASRGFPRLVPAAGTRAARAVRVSGVNLGTAIPDFRHRSVWMTLNPPELVIRAMVRSRGRGEASKAATVWTISSKLSTWRPPV
jgi:hypothetical protein